MTHHKDDASKTTCAKDVRVAVVGNVDSGKSTLVGVLTSGDLDNGRGLARGKVFLHQHEIESGRTSSMSQHIMGFDKENKPVHQLSNANASAAARTKSWTKIVAESENVMTFIDLAGHEKYLKTTIAGLTGSHCDYAMVIINALAGITKMTKEHLGVVLALKIPLLVVVTKIDMAPDNVLQQTKSQLNRVLKSQAAGKKLPMTIREEKDVETATANQSERVVPIFYTSNVTGENMPLLNSYLSKLKSGVWQKEEDRDKICIDIDQTFTVSGVGIVISGTVTSGTVFANQDLVLGPMHDGSYKPVFVRTIHSKRVPVDYAKAGDCCALSVRAKNRKEPLSREFIRAGMVMLDPAAERVAVYTFRAEILVLHHPSTIKLKYQAVVHCGILRQTAQIIDIEDKECLRTGDKATVLLEFKVRPEYIKPGAVFILREGSCKGLGKVVSLGDNVIPKDHHKV